MKSYSSNCDVYFYNGGGYRMTFVTLLPCLRMKIPCSGFLTSMPCRLKYWTGAEDSSVDTSLMAESWGTGMNVTLLPHI